MSFTGLKEKQEHIDYAFVVSMLVLISIGIIMVYSASSSIAVSKFGDANFFLKRHLIRILIGTVLFAITLKIDYRIYRKLALPGLGLSIFLLLFLLIRDVAVIKGASRWITLGGFTVQPSVVAEFAMIFYMADALDRKQEKIGNFIEGYLPLLITLCVVSVLILLEPDFSTTAVIAILTTIIFFIGNVRISHILLTGLAAMPFFFLAIIMAPYRLKRFMAFLDPEADPLGSGYQINQSLIGLGSGGLVGAGIGQSKAKLSYLPEAYTDFIYSIIGEELGYIGAMAVLLLFLIILWRGTVIAIKTPDLYGRLLAMGITLSIVLGAFINIGVVSGTLPTTGLPMPFISYGGSSLILTMAAAGVLLNISRQPSDGNKRTGRIRL